jgi:hypothetical protein
MLKTLRKIREFGYVNSGHGYTCAEMASDGLGIPRRKKK